MRNGKTGVFPVGRKAEEPLLRTEETNPEAQQQAPGAMTGREELPDELPSCLNQTVNVRFLRVDTVFWRKF
jgi:hypothetical protein